ncbi:MAG: acetate kinase [Alkalinema sp. RL_2_19]|nr:acetate kinase [Alkalinema sp. RL_2_19]
MNEIVNEPIGQSEQLLNILVLNAGSSSQKSCLYGLPIDNRLDTPPEPIWEGAIDWMHTAGQAEIQVKTADGRSFNWLLPSDDRLSVVQTLLAMLWQGETQVISNPVEIHAVGHRVVHGGQQYRHAVRIDNAVKTQIRELIPLAPAHNSVNLEGIEIAQQIFGVAVPQFAVFDTAFHSQMPEVAAVYPGSYDWLERGIRRYGFHGISHEYCAQRAAQLLKRELVELRLITCHLGNGCSLAAIRGGHSVDTTMGFTPLAGLMMGSRSGSVDPGILLYLMREKGYTAEMLDELLNRRSGLLGLSGVSNDMRLVREAMANGNAQVQLAYDVYVHRIRRAMGGMLASLDRLDALIFTAGVGEHSAAVRSDVCTGFDYLKLQIDPDKNRQNPVDRDIATVDSSVSVLVIHTQEDWQIAKTVWSLLSAGELPRS